MIGHVEWVEFARVERVPPAGQIVHASEVWHEPAGGGAVVAVQLAKLARSAGGDVVFLTALGDDEPGRRSALILRDLGVRVEATVRQHTPQRRVFTFVDATGERTITTLGPRVQPRGDDPLPWAELDGMDAVYFSAGDAGALAAGRRARVLVATAREAPLLMEAGVRLDAVVGSGMDGGERLPPAGVEPLPGLVVATQGAAGGTYRTAAGRAGRYEPAAVPAALPGEIPDAYGCGDSFAGGLTFGLAGGFALEDALALAARCGSACLSAQGPYRGQLTSV